MRRATARRRSNFMALCRLTREVTFEGSFKGLATESAEKVHEKSRGWRLVLFSFGGFKQRNGHLSRYDLRLLEFFEDEK